MNSCENEKMLLLLLLFLLLLELHLAAVSLICGTNSAELGRDTRSAKAHRYRVAKELGDREWMRKSLTSWSVVPMVL